MKLSTISFLAILNLAMVATLCGCQRKAHEAGSEATENAIAPQSTSPDAPDGIAWFKGSVEQAFEHARAVKKPVLLYWGAVWCPTCNDIKAHVFTRRDFIEKSRLFVAVFMDGDDPGAQQWSEALKVHGYPTMLVLRPDRTELARLSGGMDLSQYVDIIDLALGEVQPIETLLASIERSSAPLSLDDCKRLAYTSWNSSDEAVGVGYSLENLERVAQRCPTTARVERARLLVIAAQQALKKERAALLEGAAPSPHLSNLVREQYAVLVDTDLNRALDDVLNPNEVYFIAAERVGIATVAELRNRWIGLLEVREQDSRQSDANRVNALYRRLSLIKKRDGEIPAAMADEAVRRVEMALAQTRDSHARLPLIGASVAVLNSVGMQQRSFELLSAEVKTSPVAYYYLGMLALSEEQRANTDQALEWFERAYRETRGQASRFKGGVIYVNSLVRLRPHNEALIRDAALEVIGELDGPDGLHGRNRSRLRALDSTLRKWNSDRLHDDAIATIRRRMDEICSKSAVGGSVRSSCDSFLAESRRI